jgi:hypothetical protein
VIESSPPRACAETTVTSAVIFTLGPMDQLAAAPVRLRS